MELAIFQFWTYHSFLGFFLLCLYSEDTICRGHDLQLAMMLTAMSNINIYATRSRDPLTGCLHGTVVGPTGRSDWSVRRSYRVNASFDRSDRRSELPNMFDFVRLPIRLSKRVDTIYVRPVDQSRCSVGGTCCLRHSYIAADVIYMSLRLRLSSS